MTVINSPMAKMFCIDHAHFPDKVLGVDQETRGQKAGSSFHPSLSLLKISNIWKNYTYPPGIFCSWSHFATFA